MKILIITGASKGIGLAIAHEFRNKDWRVINISRAPSQDCENIFVDLSRCNYVELEAQLDVLLSDSQQICLVHNAFHYQSDNSHSVSGESLREAFEVNMVAPMLLNKILIPKMAAGSSILYIGSTLSEKAVANALSYCTFKHASVGMMRATCQDLMHSNIHTCCICPGFTETEMLKKHLGEDVDMMTMITKGVCGNRLIQPTEIAEFVHTCAQTPLINGSVIHANLGQIER